MRGQLAALRARYEPVVRHAYAVADQSVRRAITVTCRTLRRWTLAFLERVEAVLLSPAGRERVHAISTFALIFAFAITSVDFLIAGGGEFGSPARAARPQAPVYASVDRTPGPAVDVQVEEEIPTELAPALSEVTEANVIEVSQSFDAPTLRSERTAPARLVEVSLSAEAPLVGDDEPAAPSELRRKAPRPQK